jgi:hypothetical protein
MKYSKFLKLPKPPYALPAPRYHKHFKSAERRYLERILLDNLADESILIRAQMYNLFNASDPRASASQLVHDLDLFSSAAVRLARSLRTRKYLHSRKSRGFWDQVQPDSPQKENESQSIRSSEKEASIIIKKPFTLTDSNRELFAPLIKEKEIFPVRGRPSTDIFEILEGVLYKFIANIPWTELPECYPPFSTCNRYWNKWKRRLNLRPIMLFLIIQQIDAEYDSLRTVEEFIRHGSK